MQYFYLFMDNLNNTRARQLNGTKTQLPNSQRFSIYNYLSQNTNIINTFKPLI